MDGRCDQRAGGSDGAHHWPSTKLPGNRGRRRAYGASDEIGGHVNCIDTAPSVGSKPIDRRLVSNLNDLNAEIEKYDASNQAPNTRPKPLKDSECSQDAQEP